MARNAAANARAVVHALLSSDPGATRGVGAPGKEEATAGVS
jgi:hypothetical protein